MPRMMECLLFLAVTLLATSVDCTYVSPSRGLLITPDNIRHHASFITPRATIEQRVIRFGAGTANERLVEIPLVPAGQFNPHASVRITVGLDPTVANTGADNDPRFSITDGENINDFAIGDIGNLNGGSPPCYPTSGSHQNIGLSTRRVSGLATFLFDPYHRYGACSTGNDGGYTNVATFHNQLDLSKGTNFILRRDEPGEQYRLYYILIEILDFAG